MRTPRKGPKLASTPQDANDVNGGWAKTDPLELVADFTAAVNSMRTHYETVIQPDPLLRKTNKLRSEEGDSGLEQLGFAMCTAGKSIDDHPDYQRTLLLAGEAVSKMGDQERVMQRHSLQNVLLPFREFTRKQLPKERERLTAELHKATDATVVKKKTNEEKPALPTDEMTRLQSEIVAGDVFQRVATKHQKLLRRLMQSQLQYFEDQATLLQQAVTEIKKTNASPNDSPMTPLDK